jgi:hypothetical protein
MTKNINLLIVFLLLFFIPVVSAIDTEINVNSLGGHLASIFVLGDTGGYSLFESFHVNTDGSGFAKVTYTGSQEKFKVSVKISNSIGEKLFYEEFETFTAGNPINLKILEGDVSSNYLELDSDETSEEIVIDESPSTELDGATEVIEEIPSEEHESVSGLVVAENEEKKSFKGITIGAIIILAGGLLFIIVKKYKKRDPAYDYKKADISPTKDFEENKDRSKIKELENKINEAEEEIEKEKEKEKMRSMEQKIEKQKEELERFKKRDN